MPPRECGRDWCTGYPDRAARSRCRPRHGVHAHGKEATDAAAPRAPARARRSRAAPISGDRRSTPVVRHPGSGPRLDEVLQSFRPVVARPADRPFAIRAGNSLKLRRVRGRFFPGERVIVLR